MGFIAFRRATMSYGGRLCRKMVQDITVTDGHGVQDKTEWVEKNQDDAIKQDVFFKEIDSFWKSSGEVIIAALSIDIW